MWGDLLKPVVLFFALVMGIHPCPTWAHLDSSTTPVEPARVWTFDPGDGASYRLIIIAGSGCPSIGPSRLRLWSQAFPGARVTLIQKPWLSPEGACTPQFSRTDRLSTWLASARAAVGQLRASEEPSLLLGLSEGAEIAVHLASEVRNLKGLLLMGAPAVDPARVADFVFSRDPGWAVIKTRSASTEPDDVQLDGRSLGYWRDLLAWRLEHELSSLNMPWWRIWGTLDELIEPGAYRLTDGAMGTGIRGLGCDWPVVAGNHSLQSRNVDGIRQVGAAASDWMLTGKAMPCSAFPHKH